MNNAGKALEDFVEGAQDPGAKWCWAVIIVAVGYLAVRVLQGLGVL